MLQVTMKYIYLSICGLFVQGTLWSHANNWSQSQLEISYKNETHLHL